MPDVLANGIRLAYQRSGHGKPVLLIMGSAAAGRVWTMHQTPALTRAGYQSITFDNRGIPPSDAPPGKYSLADLMADTKGLIEALDLAPCPIVGTSLGAAIAQTLAVDHPELVDCAVLIATKARSDRFRTALNSADLTLIESGVTLPRGYAAAMSVLQMFSPASLDDDAVVSMWLQLFELSTTDAKSNGQAWIDLTDDRTESLRRITAPCRVITFADDIVTPAYLGVEVADAIPNCDLVQIPRCGHLGYLERPDVVNAAIIEFLDKHSG
jgi:pimeloyl-ACP methyl ester carboxylesterase